MQRNGLIWVAAIAGSLIALAASGAEAAPVDDLGALIAAAGTTEDHPGASTVVVFDRTMTDVEGSGLAHVVGHTVVKILTTAGAVAQGTQRFDYDPATQVIEVRAVRVHRVGGTVEAVDPAAAVDAAQPAHMIYWGARMRTLQLPRLEVGDAVEVETYRKGFMLAYLDQADADDARYVPPMRGHWYDVQVFQSSVPIIEKTVTVTTPRDKPLRYATYNGEVFCETSFDSTRFSYRFWRRDCPPLPTEWRAGGAQDTAPKVVMASTENWPQKSRWFWEANQHQFEATPEISALVEELTRGLKTDDARVAALNHWAAQNIRYCGLNMGEGEGYTLHPGDMILHERSGVCKDIAGMAITLCRAAGFEVYPAMTMAGSRVEAVPADQFNHCVGAWRRADGSWEMLDPTWIPFSRDNWSYSEGEQHYVIGTPWGEELAAIRAYAPEENGLTLTVRGTIDGDGTLTGKVELRADGQADAGLRRAIGQTPLDRIDPTLRAWLAHLAPGTDLLSWRAGDPVDFGRAMWLEAEFAAPGFATLGQEVASWRPASVALALGDYAGTVRIAAARGNVSADERKTPVFLWWAQTVTLDEEIRAPKGYAPDQPAEAAVWTAGADDDLAATDLRAVATGERMRVQGSFRFDRRQMPADTWPAFKAAVTAITEAADARLVARRKGS